MRQNWENVKEKLQFYRECFEKLGKFVACFSSFYVFLSQVLV